jgi:hypothetical protein
MDLPIATRIPSFENSFWIYLPANIITMEVKHRHPTQAIFSHRCSTPSLEAPKRSIKKKIYILDR